MVVLYSNRKTNELAILKSVYGDKKRKGLQKPALYHAFDTVENCHIEDIKSSVQSAKVFRIALLHDVLEDSNEYTPELLQDILSMSDEDIKTLKLLSRKHTDPANYLKDICKDENALVVKLGDRISNMKDLLLWIDHTGVQSISKKIAEKYLNENKELMELADEQYQSWYQGKNDNGFYTNKQLFVLASLNTRLENYLKVRNHVSGVLPFMEKKEITEHDISRVFNIIKDMYKESEDLKKTYPTMITRLGKLISKVDKLIDEKGFSHFLELFKHVKFNEDDFIKAYEKYLTEKAKSLLETLSHKSERIPKEGVMQILVEDLGVSHDQVDELVSSDNPEDLKKVYGILTKYYDEHFNDIKDYLKDNAENFGGDLLYRPTKYKDTQRAITKYLTNKQHGEVVDFLDLSDLMGFRGAMTDLGGLIGFSLSVVENEDFYMYRCKKYTGLGNAYQGVNMNISFQGKFNFEVQSTIDIVQVATDFNHDVFYKPIFEAKEHEKEAVVVLVQICLAVLFDDVFNFGIKI